LALENQLNATTDKFYYPSVVSQVTTSTAFLTRLFKRKKMRGDGTDYRWTIAYKLQSGQWYSGYEILDCTPTDDLSEAYLPWVDHTVPLAISGDELDKNSGKEARHDLLAEKMKLLRQSCTYYIGNGIFKGTGAAAKQPVGISNDSTGGAIAETASSGTYAGIVRGTDDVGSGDFTNWWRNQTKDGADAAPTLAGMEAIFRLCQIGTAQTTIIVTSKQGYSKYWSLCQPQQRIPHDDISKIGFRSLTFNGIPIVHDDHCYRDSTNNASNYYFIHEPDLELRFLTDKFMKRTPWFKPKDQDAMICRVINKFMFAVKTPRIHGVYHSCLDT